jgi:transposase
MSKESRKSSKSLPARASRYPEDIKKQAVELFKESLPEYQSRQSTAKRVAGLLGVKCFDTVLSWVNQAEIDSGERGGVSTETAAELKRLRRELAEVKRANAILKAASLRETCGPVFFAAELDRPQSK